MARISVALGENIDQLKSSGVSSVCQKLLTV